MIIKCNNEYKLIEYIAEISRCLEDKDIIGYTEEHHIIPKCLGGGDNKENLVSVSPETHLKLHRLLAQAEISRGLRWAYYNMTHIKGGEDFDIARKCKSDDMKKEGNPNYDPEKRWWYHSELGKHYLSGWELSKKYSIPRNYISNVISGKDPSTYGWRLTKEPSNNIGANHGRSIKTKYNFIHDKHGERYCIPSDISRQYPKAKDISGVAKGKRKSSAGWRLK